MRTKTNSGSVVLKAAAIVLGACLTIIGMTSASGDLVTILKLVGAEGGFDGKEAEAAERAGFLPVSLGKRILRCETAPLFVLSGAACAYELM